MKITLKKKPVLISEREARNVLELEGQRENTKEKGKQIEIKQK